MQLLTLALSLLLSLSLVSCAQVTVRDGLQCFQQDPLWGCWFEDPTIWANGTVPGPNDDVIIASNTTTFGITSYLYFILYVVLLLGWS